ncbi:hypothetical protein B566_EDAN015482, partial [Ephemera danica]
MCTITSSQLLTSITRLKRRTARLVVETAICERAKRANTSYKLTAEYKNKKISADFLQEHQQMMSRMCPLWPPINDEQKLDLEVTRFQFNLYKATHCTYLSEDPEKDEKSGSDKDGSCSDTNQGPARDLQSIYDVNNFSSTPSNNKSFTVCFVNGPCSVSPKTFVIIASILPSDASLEAVI